MPFDGSVVNAVVHELNNKIINSRIEKIFQTEKDELIIYVRGSGETVKLLLSASATFPKVHLARENKSNPDSPPSFCMLLRKHLQGGRIVSIRQPGFERIIEIDIDSADELGYSTHKTLIAEIMGRHSNIIFIDKPTKTIIDSIKRVTIEISSVREILPGREYESPPSNGKTGPLKVSRKSFIEGIEGFPLSIRAEKYIMNTYAGISPVVAGEICLRAGIDGDTDLKQCDSSRIDQLYNSFAEYFGAVLSSSFNSNIVYKDGKALDFFCFILSTYEGCEMQEFGSISEAIERFYYEKDLRERIKQRSGDLRKIIGNRLDRCHKKIELLGGELQEAEGSEKYKIYGDLIMTNVYSLKKGQETTRLLNYYSSSTEYMEIPMDLQLSPSENAQRYYKRYNKLKKARAKIGLQIEESKQEIMYLESLIDNLDKCTEEKEIEEIRSELAEQGYTKVKKVLSAKKIKVSKPMTFTSSAGFLIYVGKNNIQNDYITQKLAANQDIWLHAKDIPGSHVIIKTEGREIDDATLEEASILAAYYSKGKISSKVPVDYTRRKNVRKPPGARPGMVIYENHQTVYIDPDETKVNSIKTKAVE